MLLGFSVDVNWTFTGLTISVGIPRLICCRNAPGICSGTLCGSSYGSSRVQTSFFSGSSSALGLPLDIHCILVEIQFDIHWVFYGIPLD